MRVALHSAIQKIAFTVVSVLAMAAYLVVGARAYRAESLASHLEADSLKAATVLEPGNADYAHDLGWYLVRAQGAQSGTPYLLQAVNLNPFVSRYWLDLANAYYVSGDVPAEQQAIEHAISSDPHTPQTAWEAANFYLTQGRVDDALKQFRVVLENISDPLTPAFQLCWRATQDINTVLDITPKKPAALLELLHVMTSNQRPEEAKAVWQRVVLLHLWVDPKQVAPWIRFLVVQGRPEDAATVWQQLTDIDPELREYSSEGNLVLNGGFEHDLLDGGFDWQFPTSPEVNFALDTTQLYGGTRSLRVTFPGWPVRDTGMLQWVVVKADRTYSLSAYVRSEELLTSSGPRFEIIDGLTQKRLFLSDDILGSNSWMKIGRDFHTGPQTRLIVLRVVREPADSAIKGQLWIDNVSVTEQ